MKHPFVLCAVLALMGCGTSVNPFDHDATIADVGLCGDAGTACGRQCVDLSSNAGNCGACGALCMSPGVCRAGVCEPPCPDPSTTRCPAHATCVNLATDPANCSQCGRTCTVQEQCSQGSCVSIPVSTGAWVRIGVTATAAAAHGVSVDPAGNIFVAGDFSGTIDLGTGPLTSAGARDMFVASYAPDGTVRWAVRFGGPGDDVAHGVSANEANRVALAGSFSAGATFGASAPTAYSTRDAVAVLMDATSGRVLAVQTLWQAGPPPTPIGPTELLGGYLTTLGAFNGVGDATSAAGDVDVVWAMAPQSSWGGGPAPYGRLYAAATDTMARNSASVGATLDTADRTGWDAIIGSDQLAVFASWQTFGGAGDDYAYGVVVSPVGDTFFAVGSFQRRAQFAGVTLTSAGGDDAWIVEMTPGDQPVLVGAASFGGPGDDAALGVSLDPRGRPIMVGRYRAGFDGGFGPIGGGASHADAFVSVLHPDRSPAWVFHFGDPSTSASADTVAEGIAADGTGRVVVVGHYAGHVDFGIQQPHDAEVTGEMFVLSLPPPR